MSFARSVTVMERTTKIFKPATNVISPMKMAVTSFQPGARTALAAVPSSRCRKPTPACCAIWLAIAGAASGFCYLYSKTFTTSEAPASACAASIFTKHQLAS